MPEFRQTPTLSPLELRAEQEAMVRCDLLGPAGGLEEEVDERVVRGRYILGLLTPRGQTILPGDQDDLPAGGAAVYALYGGRHHGLYVAYAGIADAFRPRIEQHLVRRASSVTTNTAAVGLNPDYVTEVR